MSQKTLIASYKELAPPARHLAQVLALQYSPVNQFRLVTLSNRTGWLDSRRRPLTQKDCKAIVDDLLEREILVERSGQGVYVDEELQDFIIQETLREGSFERYASTVQQELPRESTADSWIRYPERFPRDLRIAFYRNDVSSFRKLLGHRFSYASALWPPPRFLDPFARDIFDRLEPQLKQLVLRDAVVEAIHLGRGNREALEAVDNVGDTLDPPTDLFISCWLDLLVAKGDLDGLHRLDGRFEGSLSEIAGCEAFLRGDFEKAEKAFDAAVLRIRKTTRKKKVAIPHFPAFFHVCLLLEKNAPAARESAKTIISAALNQWSSYRAMMQPLISAIKLQEDPDADPWAALEDFSQNTPLCEWTAGLVWSWFLREERFPFRAANLRTAATDYEALGLHWLGAEMASLLQRAEDSTCDERKTAAVSLTGWLEPEPPWIRSLNAMSQLGEASVPGKANGDAEASERLIWELEFAPEEDWLHLQPYVQKRTKGGAWTKGRPVSLKRLYSRDSAPSLSFLSEEDRALCRCLTVSRSYRYYGRYLQESFGFDMKRAAAAMVGHPRIFRPNERKHPLEIVEQDPELVVTQNEDGGIHLALYPELDEGECAIREDGPHRVVVTPFTEQQKRLSGILKGGLVVPGEASERVLDTVRAVASVVSVHSEIGDSARASETVVADPRPHIHLTPFQHGIRTEFFVRPFGDTGPFYRAGEGGENVFARVNDQSQTARRDLSEELTRQEEVFSSCPCILQHEGAWDDPLVFATAQDALQLLLELKPLVESERVILHWPQGETFRLAGEVDASRFRVRIRQDRDWFAASGSLGISEHESLDLGELATLVDRAHSRFIQLSDGRFLALTEQLRRCIRDLAVFGNVEKDTIRFPAVRANMFESLAELEGTETDRHWTETMQRMHAAGDLEPEPPGTLQTELRDYQKEGYQWLRRLAHWGVGACLADDMGLGKTIQALALLLDRGQSGPALVVAPASVTLNWASEMHRFAPVLQPKFLGLVDREAFFQKLGPHDVVIASYGLLNTSAERFHARHWHTVILDEAQAIKNMESKRSRAAMGLDADFRIVMTGTPMENHLGELWNLFQFINPGLLGSLDEFQRRFATPIERDKSRNARARLKRLIQPFILRRTKSEVLDELPSRTDVTLHVQLSKEEAALYETLRKEALRKLAQEDPKSQGPQHLRILAELMRLRRACCHPRLVWPECPLPGSKLALFNETIDNLLENRHQVLVFSQFVDHLSILREELDRKRIAYQYLDGRTPVRERKRRIAAFQAGQGEVFLISLKAGGTGLNLTAADYVIHMDPWWNPAVEDQASDRAHRIGQERPVTIYRLVTEGTIEEKIVELHKSKRDLADSLLEGADLSSKLSAQDLLQLLKQEA